MKLFVVIFIGFALMGYGISAAEKEKREPKTPLPDPTKPIESLQPGDAKNTFKKAQEEQDECSKKSSKEEQEQCRKYLLTIQRSKE